MTIDTARLRAGWAFLSAPRNAELNAFDLGVRLGPGTARIALDRYGHRHLLVPTGGEAITSDKRPSVLFMQRRQLTFNGVVVDYLDASCSDSSLNPEFDDLILDVLDAVSGSATPAAAAAEAIDRWRRLFRSLGGRGLSELARRGLFAELTVLLAFVDASDAITSAHWTGPDREAHDFDTGDALFEVKAPGVDGAEVVIHGLAQLDRPATGSLTLLVVTLAQDDEGQTLADLVKQARRALPGDPGLVAKLAQAGYREQDAVSQVQGYSVVDFLEVPVDDQCPRLVPGSLIGGALPAGVGRVQYRVEMASLAARSTGRSLAEVAAELAS